MKDTQKYLGIDYGLKRVGFSISDPISQCVFPLCTLDRSVKTKFYEEMQALFEKHRPDAFVLGLPFHDDGNPCTTTAQVKNFAASLARRFTVPIYYMEELLSSHEAESNMKEYGVKAKKIKQLVDQEAAVLILSSFLNSDYRVLAQNEPKK